MSESVAKLAAAFEKPKTHRGLLEALEFAKAVLPLVPQLEATEKLTADLAAARERIAALELACELRRQPHESGVEESVLVLRSALMDRLKDGAEATADLAACRAEAGGLREACELARIELGYLIEQTKSRPGMAVDRAYQACRKALAAAGRATQTEEPR